jgi:hypothetical protein
MSYPLSAFNFAVEIYPDGASSPLAEAAFAECDGLELTMDVKTIREGGANDRAYRVPGVINYANVTLKRGMTANLDLWKWVQVGLGEESRGPPSEPTPPVPGGIQGAWSVPSSEGAHPAAGTIAPTNTTPRHHRTTTLRRTTLGRSSGTRRRFKRAACAGVRKSPR